MKDLAKGRPLRFFVLLIAGVVSLLVDGCGQNNSLPTYNVAGGWFIYHETDGTPGEQGPDLFSFSQNGNNDITGSTPLGVAITGTVNADTITFSWVDAVGAVNQYTGVVGNFASMSGVWANTLGQSGTWHAMFNAPATVIITGLWKVFYTPSGSFAEQGPSLVTLAQSLNNVAGTTDQGQTLIGSLAGTNVVFSWTGSDGVTNIFVGQATTGGGTFVLSMAGTWRTSSGQLGIWRAVPG